PQAGAEADLPARPGAGGRRKRRLDWGQRVAAIHSARAVLARSEYRRLRSALRVRPGIGGNRPKFTFIGWYVAASASPVMWLSSAPNAVVGGGGGSVRPPNSAAAKRAASRPTAADSI